MSHPSTSSSSSTTILPPRRKATRPSSWFMSTSLQSPALAAVKTPIDQANPFQAPHAPPTAFRSPSSTIMGKKHKLSPSPSPRHHDFEFAMASPRPPLLERTPNRTMDHGSDNSSSPIADSPTPGFASVSGKVKLVDLDDSPIRNVPGRSRSLAAARSNSQDLFSPGSPTSPKPLFTERGSSPTFEVPPPPIFQPIRQSQSAQECNPWRVARQTKLRPSASSRTREKLSSLASQKKAVSLTNIQADNLDEPFGNAFLHGRKARSSMPVTNAARSERAHPHRRTPGEGSLSRSAGQKSGLSLSLLSPNNRRPDLGSHSSISSISSAASLTPPTEETAIFESNKHLFDNIKPNPEIFDSALGIKQKFKGKDSTSSNEGDRPMQPPPSVRRSGTLPFVGSSNFAATSSVKRARSLNTRPEGLSSDVPSDSLDSKYDSVVNGVSRFVLQHDEKPMMPNTPVKRHAFNHPRSSGRIAMSHSQPALGTDAESIFSPGLGFALPQGSARKPPPSMRNLDSHVPYLTVTTTSSPDSGMDQDSSSPTTGLGSIKRSAGTARISLLRRISSQSHLSGSEDEVTPTKGGGPATILAAASSLKTPTPSPARPIALSRSLNTSVVPRLSLPALDGQSKADRRRAHRQSVPIAPPELPEDEDILESRFIVVEPLGRGAFSTVLRVEARNGSGFFAVKVTRGVFDGVKDRLRHLEEVDILRHLSKTHNDHVLKFVDAWEQNRQLYIQTEQCVGSLAAFLEVYGKDNEKLEEARVWKIARDIADGIRHMHDNGVIHFDLKPENILVDANKTLKIADFGFATRWPRISPAEIIAGSGLGGSIGDNVRQEKLHREGDKIYMPPEMLHGVFVAAADIFSFGLIIFETAMNIFLPTGGEHWTALRNDNFSQFKELENLSPQLSDFITAMLQSDPDLRPTIHNVLDHPVIQRSWFGGAAIAVEDSNWLAWLLSGSGTPSPPAAFPSPLDGLDLDGEGDVIMGDA